MPVSPFLLICSYYFPFITSTTPHTAVSLSIWPLEPKRSITFLMLFVITLQPSTRREQVSVFGVLRISIGAPWASCLKEASSHPAWVRNTNSRKRFVYLRAGNAARCVSEWCRKNISCLWRYLLACSGWQCSCFASAHSFHHLFIDFPFLCQNSTASQHRTAWCIYATSSLRHDVLCCVLFV